MNVLMSWLISPDVLALLALAGMALVLVIVRLRLRSYPHFLDDEMVRREMIDECFSKGQMTRRQCEGGRSTGG